ncbi:putative Zn-dependent peptidase [Lewinella marina]|uniref:Peptidase M16 n=1 Tax=Neolewinella marina TaxID=438751 RepID=A0A2G0CBH1_9BACT|nr:pitrilysin family protein [Neolewinella marina]NJB87150.1 putative Zn-dependent peptidase [Neolewinella marina]PHK97323.1 peptidase M16 [Neolewinella marina]
MIDFESYTLDNGLTVLLHHDEQRTVATVNVLYKVGSRNDPPHRTGFAHLFEHLMFAGSENVPNFDDALQLAGGENNALTSSDYTLYYDTLPAENLETALWLESDRMRKLRFSEASLANEKRVVIEEFRETCLEQPYGDLYHHLNGLIYKEHPYRWPVIGQDISHIRGARLGEVKDFYYRYYRPDNAILCIAGNFDPATIRERIEYWFASIPPSDASLPRPEIAPEPPQEEYRHLRVSGDVPSPVIYLHFRTVDRLHPDFPATDILSFLLGGGRSSLLYRRLVRDTELFAEVSAGINDNLEAGGIIVEARPSEDVDYDEARIALHAAIAEMVEHGISQEELDKVVNRLEQRNHYREANISSRANELILFALLGQPDLINTEMESYLALTVEELNEVARRYLRPENCVELEYLSDPAE